MRVNRRGERNRLHSLVLAGLGWCCWPQPMQAELVLQRVYTSAASLSAGPFSSLVQAADGNFFGTTVHTNFGPYGAVIRMTPAGVVTTHVPFLGSNGKSTEGGLLLAKDGNLYGTTFAGGTYNYGTLFKVTPTGGFQTLHAFSGTEGAIPQHTLVQASDGCLYGLTVGSRDQPPSGATLFRATTAGAVTTVTNLPKALGALVASSATPTDGLMQGPDGWLYGTATFTSPTGGEFGAIYKVATNGTFQTLASFPCLPTGSSSSTGGNWPIGGLTAGPDGFLYGTLGHGSGRTTTASTNYGGVFQMTTNGMVTMLVTFAGTNGANPMTRLLLGRDGAFYGLTTEGGANNRGTIFRVTTNGVLTTLADGVGAVGINNSPNPLMQAADGNFYGTGMASSGTTPASIVFRLVPPPVITRGTLSSGKVALTWNSFSNGTYQVAYKDSAAATNWTTLSSSIVATGATASVSYSLGTTPQRFYRVLLLP